MEKQMFKAVLIRPEGIGTWTYLDIPFDVKKICNEKSRIQVKGTINNIPYRSTLLPHGDGTFFMVVNKTIRDQLGVHAGDSVKVQMTIDTDLREVQLPELFEKTLRKNPKEQAIFNTLSYSHKKQYLEWIMTAKKEETRKQRIQQTIGMLLTKKSPKQRK